VEVPYTPIAPPPAATPPVEAPIANPPPPNVTKKEEPDNPSPVAAKPPAVEANKPRVIDRREEEGRVKDALAQYERGFDNLDADAVRSVWPGAPANLRDTFAQYQFYRLEMVCEAISLNPEMTTATTLCRLGHFFEPKVGRRQTQDQRRQFSLQKRGNSWIIVTITSR
jgi:hypothetical protein